MAGRLDDRPAPRSQTHDAEDQPGPDFTDGGQPGEPGDFDPRWDAQGWPRNISARAITTIRPVATNPILAIAAERRVGRGPHRAWFDEPAKVAGSMPEPLFK